jgi:hypothetical protein
VGADQGDLPGNYPVWTSAHQEGDCQSVINFSALMCSTYDANLKPWLLEISIRKEGFAICVAMFA